MNTGKKFFMAGAAIAVIAGAAFFCVQSAQADTANLNLQATIVAPLDLTCATTLNFGSIDANGGGDVVVNTDGTSSTTGPIRIGATGLARGQCTTTGSGTLAYTVTIPAGSVDDAGAGAPMVVDDFQIDDGTNGPGPAVGGYATALVAGAGTLNIGATLAVAAGQVAGVYTGTVVVTANYN